VLTFGGASLAQPPDSLWRRAYGGDGNDWGMSLVETPNGDCVMSGHSWRGDQIQWDYTLVRVDQDGNLLEGWPCYYGGPDDDMYPSVVNTADGGLAMLGRTRSWGAGNTDFWLVRTDEEGNDIWGDDRRVYGTDIYEGRLNQTCALIQLQDRRFAFGGMREPNLVWATTDAPMYITDEDGGNQQLHIFGTDNNLDIFMEFIETEDGILCAGATSSGDADECDPWLLMFDPEEEEEVWSRTIQLEDGNRILGGVQTADGGYAFVGLTNWTVNQEIPQARVDAMILRTDAEGNLLWSRFYGGNQADVFFSLVELHNGAFAIVGHTISYGAGNTDGWLMITDDQGDSLWSFVHGFGGDDQLVDIYEAGDNDLVMGGGITIENNSQLWLLRYSMPEFGFIEGHVLNAEDDRPLEGATVSIPDGRSTTTDEQGYYLLTYAWADDALLTASIEGYNDSTFTDLEMAVDETLEVNFGLLHPEMSLSPEEISVDLGQGESTERPITASNIGNGTLEWSVKPRLAGEAGVDPWEMRQSFYTGQEVDDSRLQGVVFVDERYYVAGGGNDINRVYVLDGNGDSLRSFAQFSNSNYGMNDLAWDGELIWGVDGQTVYGFTTDGEERESFEAWVGSLKGIAYDGDSLLYVCSVISDIKGYNRAGEELLELDNPGFRIYGMAYWQDDPDGYPLYIFHNLPDNPQLVHKMNPVNGDNLFVRELVPEGGGSPVGAFVTDQYDSLGSWVFMDIASAPSDSGGDRVDVWQLKPTIGWMSIEPSEGVINATEEQALVLTLDASDLNPVIFEGLLVFTHNAASAHDTVWVTMNLPVFEDNRQPLPTDFAITSVYPNPFNSMTRITYNLPHPSPVSLQLFDLTGRRVKTLFEDYQHPGIHTTILTANDLPSGLYFIRLNANDEVFTQKIMLIR